MHYQSGVPKATIAEIALVVCADVNLGCYPTLEELNRFVAAAPLIGNVIFECGVAGCKSRAEAAHLYNLGGWVVCERHGLDITAILHTGGFTQRRNFAGYRLAQTLEGIVQFRRAHPEIEAKKAERFRVRINREEFRRRALRSMPPIPSAKPRLRLVGR